MSTSPNPGVPEFRVIGVTGIPLVQKDDDVAQQIFDAAAAQGTPIEDGDIIDVRTGETLVIPSNVEHAAVAMEDTVDMDCFSPIREDWLSGDDAYLRGGDED